jgi:mannan endo-1,4-beta-mannosidase
MNLIQILGLAAGSAWTSGINLYATVAVLGLLQKYKLASLPGGLEHLDNWLVIGVAAGLYCVEFFADKIPYVDTVWDAVHTFIRVPAGAVLAFAATAETSPTVQVLALLLGGTVALSSHGTKATVRATANLIPEPVSNWILSVVEDILAVAGVVLSIVAPVVALFLVAAFLVLFIWLMPKVLRRLRRMIAAARDFFLGRRGAGVRPALLLPLLPVSFLASAAEASAKPSFVTVKGHQLYLDGKPYYFVGTNYWYGSLLGLMKDEKRGVERLRKELDFLKSQGVKNLRLLAGAEGSGMINGVVRVGPPLQPRQGEFSEEVLGGLDLVLHEMGKRDMKAVVFLSNNWEWSGGFQQYLIWNGKVPEELKTRKLNWDEQRDVVSQFYGCEPCTAAYARQANLLLDRVNKYNRKRYAEDPALMAWELANEPRPMRPAAAEAYRRWVADVAALIKSKDRNHLVVVGHEGRMGTEDLKLFEEIHADPNIDYLTIHIWPKNWSWFKGHEIAADFEGVAEKTLAYVEEHLRVAERLGKPLVLEEFGLPRDGHSFDPAAPTTLRDNLYSKVFNVLTRHAASGGPVAGANFWAFGGRARPVRGQTFWKEGDDYTGDPPMEEQGLNSVFDGDATTWRLIKSTTKELEKSRKNSRPAR